MALLKCREYDPYVLRFLNEQIEPVQKNHIFDSMIKLFDVSPEDLLQVTKKNKYPLFKDRIDWALVYLKQAELINNIDRGIYQISDFGKNFYKDYPNFTFEIMKEKTPFLANRKKRNEDKINRLSEKELEKNNDINLATINYYESVEFDILDRLKKLGTHTVGKGTQFEDVCLDLLEKMGYGK